MIDKFVIIISSMLNYVGRDVQITIQYNGNIPSPHSEEQPFPFFIVIIRKMALDKSL